jgi:PAS domain S-box-containing protein
MYPPQAVRSIVSITFTRHSLDCLPVLDMETYTSPGCPMEDQSKTREQLLQELAEFRTLAEHAYDWAYWLGPDGKFRYLSPSCQRITGYSAAEFMADPALLERIIHPDDREAVFRHLHGELDRPEPVSMQFRIISRTGKEQWIEHVCQSVYGVDGRWLGRRASNRDITDRRRAVEALSREEAFSETIINGIPGWFYVLDRQGRFVRWNHVVEETTGFSSEKLRGMDCLLSIFEDDRELVASKIREVFENAQAEVQARVVLKDEARHFLLSGRRMDVGLNSYIVGNGVDITERHRMEKRVARLNRRKEQLLGPGGVSEKLALLTDGVVEVLGADFARIWVIREGDLCEKGCRHATVTEGPHVCRDRTCCLHLVASSGRYPRVDGSHRRVPLGCYKIGRVASGDDAGFVTNDVTHDPRVHDHRWAESLGLVSFAGYRLLSPEGKALGVLAMFSQRVIDAGDKALLEDVAATASHAIRAGLAEESLLRSEEIARRRLTEIEAIYNSAPTGLCVFDTQLCYVRINERLAEMNGVPAAEHIGRTTRDVVPALANWMEAMLRQVIQTGQPILNVEFTGTTPAQPGVPRTWIVHWLPLNHSPTHVAGVSVVMEEISERKRAEKALREARDELEHRVKERTAELTRVVEELRSEVQQRIRAEQALRQERRTLEHMLRASDHERQLIAYDIHDCLAQQLAGAIMQFQVYSHLLTFAR